jgi:hypothetical protein
VSAPLGGLDWCACKRGFFTLRNCTNAAVTSCTSCTRRICAEHMAPDNLCVECAAKRDEERDVDSPDRVDLSPTRSAVRYRTHWYSSSGYEPMYWATYDPYYSDTDYRWYDDPNAGDDSGDDGGGFDDS